jgi:hypothetical protein
MEKPAETEDQPEDIQERRKEGGESGCYHMFKQWPPWQCDARPASLGKTLGGWKFHVSARLLTSGGHPVASARSLVA